MGKAKKPQSRTLLKVGGGPPPGYRWTVKSHKRVPAESERAGNAPQIEHIRDQVRDLARAPEPANCPTLDVKPIEDFYELRDRGGVLNAKNLRVFFGIDHENRTIVLLGVLFKQNNDQTPPEEKLKIRRRWRQYKDEVAT